MAHFNLRIFFRSFRFAMKGLCYAARHEQSFRVQLTIALAVVFLMLVLRVRRDDAVVLLLVVTGVLVLELLNTVLEKFIDAMKPRVHYFVETMKDLMAAAVFLAALTAFILGLLIFLPYLFPS